MSTLGFVYKQTVQNLIKKKYRNFLIDTKNSKKPTPENLIQWVYESWYSNDISEDIIKQSFKKGGINLKFDGSEDLVFDWPKNPDMILIEKIPSLSMNNNIENFMEFNIKKNNNINESDSDEDI